MSFPFINTLADAVGPERLAGQGLDPNQHASGNTAIAHLLTSEQGRAWTDFVATYRVEADGSGAYEAWSRRGMARWQRRIGSDGHYEYLLLDVEDENPLRNQDPFALSTIESELAAGFSPLNPERAFVPAERLSYPYAYERISQLFDSPNAADLVVNAKSYTYGRSPGQHGNLDVIQSRSPLIFSGPGVKRATTVAIESRQIDIAPTIAQIMRFPLIDGRNDTGRTSSERGVAPDVYLGRQDGDVLEGVLDSESGAPARVYLLLLDGQSHTELRYRLAAGKMAIPNLRRLIDRGVLLEHGSITNYPSITWPSHNAIGTGAWCGHHDVVNPSYYLRETRETVSPQGQQFDTAKFLSPDVETLFEAFHRVYGAWDGAHGGALTASIIEPCVRGADHATLENRLVGEKRQLIELTNETAHEISPRWKDELEEHGHRMMGEIDNRGLAQARLLFMDESHAAPMFVFHEFSQPDSAAHDYGPHHEGARQALDETDVRIGHILRLLDDRGLFESTLFVITTDHGMAIQDTEQKANPAWIPHRQGMAAVITDPLVYLRDLAIEIEVAHDGRTVHLQVNDNDADTSGERPVIAGAEVVVSDGEGAFIARGYTSESGSAGLPIPIDLRAGEMSARISAEGFNARTLSLDGVEVILDLKALLYGARE